MVVLLVKNTLLTKPLHPRPVYLNLLRITMPVGAVTSILHRITGLLLAMGVPLAMALLWRSMGSEEGFMQVKALLANGVFQALLVALVWALAHHALAGVRHKLIEIHKG